MTDSAPIEGVRVTPLKRIPDERGDVLHMLRSDDPHFVRFGEIYFSEIRPGAVKAWRRHREMTLNYAVPAGRIKLVLRSASGRTNEHHIGGENYCLVTIPPGVWYGFKGLGESVSLVANCASVPHDEQDIERADETHFDYDWSHD